jgi:uncharacterized protein YndB with AHSA1/START domain
MTEFEQERAMPAGPEAVFAVVADLERLGDWLPPAVAVQPVDDAGPGTTRAVHAEVEPHGGGAHGVDARGLARVRPEQRRVEWGGGDSGDYAGYLQVMGDDPDRSSVLVHLSFLGDQPETHGGAAAEEVRAWLDDALGRLERLVGQAGATS